MKPPTHLGAHSRKFWAKTVSDYELEEHHLLILRAALESWDRAELARRIIADEGPVVRDRFGQPRAHPAVAIERDARAAFLRAMRELDLDGEPAPDIRPPRLGRNR